MSARTTTPSTTTLSLLSKVPEVTIYFWIIKVLCTTVGESAADFINVNLNLGLTGTSIITGVLLAVAMFFQFRTDRYLPAVYWLTVALVSVFGTLVTDNLTDKAGIPLQASTILFGTLLAVTFVGWYRAEGTLSIHSIFTVRREALYWLAVLFSFALGTATGDLMAEELGLGYLTTGIIVAVLIGLTAAAWRFKLNSVLAFWIIYILTRPLGASIGDELSQPATYGGLGLGATITSLIFVAAILAVVTFLSITHADAIRASTTAEKVEADETGGLWQTVVVVSLSLIIGLVGYSMRKASLDAEAADPSGDTTATAPATPGATTKPGAAAQPTKSPLGDLSAFRTITQDTLTRLTAGDQAGATARVADLEHEWDTAEARLKPKSKDAWTEVDGKIDTVLRQLRSTSPNVNDEKAALNALLTSLG